MNLSLMVYIFINPGKNIRRWFFLPETWNREKWNAKPKGFIWISNVKIWQKSSRLKMDWLSTAWLLLPLSCFDFLSFFSFLTSMKRKSFFSFISENWSFRVWYNFFRFQFLNNFFLLPKSDFVILNNKYPFTV